MQRLFMSAQDDKTRLSHIKEAAQKIIKYTDEKTQSDFENDEVLQLAIVRLIEIVGEAAARLSNDLKVNNEEIPWQAIIGMRNRLVHAYFAIDYDVVWQTVQEAIPELLTKIEALELPDNEADTNTEN